jgi:hypothetical protein
MLLENNEKGDIHVQYQKFTAHRAETERLSAANDTAPTTGSDKAHQTNLLQLSQW